MHLRSLAVLLGIVCALIGPWTSGHYRVELNDGSSISCDFVDTGTTGALSSVHSRDALCAIEQNARGSQACRNLSPHTDGTSGALWLARALLEAELPRERLSRWRALLHRQSADPHLC